MGTVIINDRTTVDPITMIGEVAGICYGVDVSNEEKNYRRGVECIKRNHGRTLEYPTLIMTIDGFSARVIRELYVHIVNVSRLQASTRYIDYSDFEFIVPKSIQNNEEAAQEYNDAILAIKKSCSGLHDLGIPNEDISNLLPLGMKTTVVVKYSPRTLVEMAKTRTCSRAYWEFRDLFEEIKSALSNYSIEWKEFVEIALKTQCDILGHCPEKKSCGRYPTA